MQSYPATVLNERIVIFFCGEGVKTYSDPSYIFSGVKNFELPRIYAPGIYTLWKPNVLYNFIRKI